MSKVFDCSVDNISLHLKNIFKENELDENAVAEESSITASDGKNYLNEEELQKLNDLTNFFIVFAEDEAKERHIMTMKDWIEATDDLLKFRRKNILDNAGSVSHEQAIEKANIEYEKFKVKQDMKYISSMDEMYQRYLKENDPLASS